MSIFERKSLPLSSAPLYYQALAELVQRHWGRLHKRIHTDESEAKAYLNLFRGEASAFQSTVIEHIDQKHKSEESTRARRQAMKDASAWIGFVRRGAGTAARRLPNKKDRESLKSLLHAGRELSRNSVGEVLLETRYLNALLPEVSAQISPPLHQDELTRGASLADALETATYGRASASADQAQASVAKSHAWDVLEDKSIYLLELARLEFSKDPEHPDYATRLQFEGLDEKFAPAPRESTPKEAPQKAT